MVKKKQNKKPPRIPQHQKAQADPVEENDSASELAEKLTSLWNAFLDMISVPHVLLLSVILLLILLLAAGILHSGTHNQSRAVYAYEHQDWQAAIDKFERLNFEEKLMVQGASSLVHAYVEAGRSGEALQSGEALLTDIQARLTGPELDPGKMRMLLNEQFRLLGFMSWAMLTEGRQDEALQMASQIIENHPNDPVANITLGRIAIKNSDLDKAREHYQIVAESQAFRRYYTEFDKLVKP